MSHIGTGEGESPLASPPAGLPTGQAGGPPRTPSTEARTFSSDLGSIKSSGGAEPMPYTPSAAPRPAFTPPSGMALGRDPLPKPGGIPPVTPIPLSIPPAAKSGGKKVFVAVLSFLIVIALGAVGYFFVYPLFTEEPPVMTPPPASPTLPEPETPATPEIPQATGEDATSTPSEPSEEPETPASDPWSGVPGLSSHRTAFTAAPDTTTEVILASPTLGALKAALPSGSVATPLMSEVVLKMPSGNTVSFTTLASLLAPTFFTSERIASFDDDATYFTYASANGTWLGIVAPLKAGAAIGPVQDAMSQLQGDPNLANFFIEDPGEKGVWADGSVRGKPTSQVSFETPGATFSYTWLDRNLLISTNLTGAEMAAERLGF